MADIHSGGYCPTCQRPSHFVKARSSNGLHLFLSIITGGLWLIVWLFVGVGNSGSSGLRCSTCGSAPGAAPRVTSGPAPGWYPDPIGVGEVRYWDGGWSDQVASAGVVSVRPFAAPPPPVVA